MFKSSRLEQAWKQIEFARAYTLELIETFDRDEWFLQPNDCHTHLAWHVGHLAMAEYGLTLFRTRGRQSIDTELMSGKFRKQFSKGTSPDPNPDNNPPIDEILDVLEKVHRQAAEELPTFEDSLLDEESDMPYMVHATKLGGVLFCSHHEMIHAGQIGFLRRLLGKEPVR